jgi:hypothetical protein
MEKKISEILAPMSFSEKVRYLWQYYRLHFFVTIAILLIAGTTINSIADRKDIVLNVVLMGAMVDTEKVGELDDQLDIELLSEEEVKSSDVSFRFIKFKSGSLDQESSIGMQKMAAEITSKSIDVLIVSKVLFDQFSNDGQVLPLEELDGFDMKRFEEDQLLKSSEGKIIGISISNMKMFDEVVYDEDLIMCIPANVQNLDRTSQFFEIVK